MIAIAPIIRVAMRMMGAAMGILAGATVFAFGVLLLWSFFGGDPVNTENLSSKIDIVVRWAMTAIALGVAAGFTIMFASTTMTLTLAYANFKAKRSVKKNIDSKKLEE